MSFAPPDSARDLIHVKEVSGCRSYFRSTKYAMKMNGKGLERHQLDGFLRVRRPGHTCIILSASVAFGID